MANTKITTRVLTDGAITSAKLADDAVSIAKLDVTDGTNGQVLKTDGNGTLTFTDMTADTDTTYSVGDGGLTQVNFTTADNTKLDGIEALADVTDTTNVVSALTAGTNVTISGAGEIASTDTDTTYSAGTGLSLSGTTFSSTITQYADSDVGTYLSSNGYATQSTVVAAITDSAPATLDTLNELAAALGDDANFSTTVTNSIALKAPLASPTFTGQLNTVTSSGTFGAIITNNNDGSQGLQVRTSDNDTGLHILDLQTSSSATGTDYASVFNVSKSGTVTSTAGFTTGANTRVQSSSGMLFLNGPSALAFEVGAGTEKMRLTSTGLGIGTESPDKLLEVSGTDVVAKFTGTDAAPPQIEFADSIGVQATIGLNGGHDFIIDTAGENVYIGSDAAASAESSLTILATGLVGIGTPSPTDPLTIHNGTPSIRV